MPHSRVLRQIRRGTGAEGQTPRASLEPLLKESPTKAYHGIRRTIPLPERSVMRQVRRLFISPAKFPILGKNVIMPRKSLPDRTDEINDSLSYNIGRNIYPCELLVSKLPPEQRVIKDRSQSANDCIWRSLAHLPVLVYV